MKEIFVGSSDFSKLVQNDAYFVDKSLLIKEFIDSGNEVTLVTRPRRWGKSLNLSMLYNFFNDNGDGISKKDLFKDLNIVKEKIENEQQTYVDKCQGKSPVIMLSFKDIGKEENFTAVKKSIARLLSKCCSRLQESKYVANYLANNKDEKLVKDFNKLLGEEEDDALLKDALGCLSFMLNKASSKKVYIFIDEYDNPINKAFGTKYFTDLSEFMKIFFSAGLKDNTCLEKGLMTGILRISQSSMLSGLNNLSVYTVLDKKYAAYFGFTENEVNDLLMHYNLEEHGKEIKTWYNGYNIGSMVIYNPWSIMNGIKERQGDKNASLKGYWAESGTNDLIKETLTEANKEIKKQLQMLSQSDGKLINIIADVKVRFDQLSKKPNAFWSLLLATGYLTATDIKPEVGTEYKCNLAIPNQEIRGIFKQCIDEWVDDQKIKYIDYWKHLANGDVNEFKKALKKFIESSASLKDAQNNQKKLENFYHGFMLGLSFGIQSHIVKSNVESGFGYYDLLIKPKEKKIDSLGVILEFKIPGIGEKLEHAAQKGLEQAIANKYITELENEGYKDFLVIGISFLNKDICVESTRGTSSKDLKEKFINLNKSEITNFDEEKEEEEKDENNEKNEKKRKRNIKKKEENSDSENEKKESDNESNQEEFQGGLAEKNSEKKKKIGSSNPKDEKKNTNVGFGSNSMTTFGNSNQQQNNEQKNWCKN